MPRRPARFTQHEVEVAIKAARKQGAHAVEVKTGETVIRVELSPQSTGSDGANDPKAVEPRKEIVL